MLSPAKGWHRKFIATNAPTGTVKVGCANSCDAFKGDTPCTAALPILCIKKSGAGFPLPLPSSVNDSDQYYRWTGGVIGTTAETVPPPTLAAVNAICAQAFGADWRVAEFHDGWGWNFQAYGGVGGTANASGSTSMITTGSDLLEIEVIDRGGHRSRERLRRSSGTEPPLRPGEGRTRGAGTGCGLEKVFPLPRLVSAPFVRRQHDAGKGHGEQAGQQDRRHGAGSIGSHEHLLGRCPVSRVQVPYDPWIGGIGVSVHQ